MYSYPACKACKDTSSRRLPKACVLAHWCITQQTDRTRASAKVVLQRTCSSGPLRHHCVFGTIDDVHFCRSCGRRSTLIMVWDRPACQVSDEVHSDELNCSDHPPSLPFHTVICISFAAAISWNTDPEGPAGPNSTFGTMQQAVNGSPAHTLHVQRYANISAMKFATVSAEPWRNIIMQCDTLLMIAH